MRIIFATHNKNKMTEVRQILGDLATDIVAKSELGIDFEPVETVKTFAENAELKAVGIRSYMLAHHLLEDDDIIKELTDMELSTMTPIDALNTLYRIQTKLKNRW